MQIIPIKIPTVENPPETWVCSGQPLPIGYVGENGVRAVALDFSAWIEAYGAGVLTLLVRRQGDPDAYPVLLKIEGTTAQWLVSNIDTHVFGVGKAQYMYIPAGSDNNAKSAAFPFFVDKAVTQPGTNPPNPYDGWVQELTELGAETLQNAQDAEQSANNADAARILADQAAAIAAQSQEAAANSESGARAFANAAASAATASSQSKTAAETEALKAEAWAVGERGGEPVPSGDPTYQNNAKFYAEVAQQGAEESGFAFFDVDVESGEMIATVTANLAASMSFAVNENLGILEVTLQ